MNRNVYFPDPTPERDEYAEIKAAADAKGESLSEFMRKASFERIERDKPAERRTKRASSSATA